MVTSICFTFLDIYREIPTQKKSSSKLANNKNFTIHFSYVTELNSFLERVCADPFSFNFFNPKNQKSNHNKKSEGRITVNVSCLNKKIITLSGILRITSQNITT